MHAAPKERAVATGGDDASRATKRQAGGAGNQGAVSWVGCRTCRGRLHGRQMGSAGRSNLSGRAAPPGNARRGAGTRHRAGHGTVAELGQLTFCALRRQEAASGSHRWSGGLDGTRGGNGFQDGLPQTRRLPARRLRSGRSGGRLMSHACRWKTAHWSAAHGLDVLFGQHWHGRRLCADLRHGGLRRRHVHAWRGAVGRSSKHGSRGRRGHDRSTNRTGSADPGELCGHGQRVLTGTALKLENVAHGREEPQALLSCLKSLMGSIPTSRLSIKFIIFGKFQGNQGVRSR